jgi:hypothetical protein
MPTIALVELHDARVASLTLVIGGELKVRLGHVAVYERRDESSYDVVSYEGEITFSDASDFRLSGRLDAGNQVSAMEFNGADLGSVKLSELALSGTTTPAGEVRLVFSGGGVMCLRAATMSVKLGPRGEVFEEWKGPL